MADTSQDVLQTRLKKVQEKNKRAQARYRQKQKEKMNGFEEQCHQLTDHLKELQLAYNKLQAERNILQLELQSRENTHGSASSGRDDASGQAVTSPQSSAQPCRPHRPTPTGWGKFAQTGEQTYYHDFVRKIVSKYVGEEQAREADDNPFKKITPHEIAAIYKGLLEEVKSRLATVDREGTPEAHKAVVDVIQAMRTMGRRYEENLTKQQRVEDGTGLREVMNKEHGAIESDLWRKVLFEARVSPAQRDRILALRNSHLQKMESIVRERKDIVWEMQQATVVPETASARQTAFAKLIKSSQQLQESLVEEHLAKEDFFRSVCHQTLNEMQEARMLVAATPHMLDVAAICDLLAAGTQDTTTQPEKDSFGNRPVRPAILQIPALVDSDLTPDQYHAAFAYGCNQENGADILGSRFMGYQRLPQLVSRPMPLLGGLGSGNGPVNHFAGGGNGSVFAPPRPIANPPSRGL